MKKLFAIVLCVALLLTSVAAFAEVELTMSSWRVDDTAKIQALLDKYAEASGVKIKFEGVTPQEYNATLRLRLDSGTGPDIFYARSYETGRELFAAGHEMDCSDIPGVKENFTASSLDPWQNADGSMYAVPFAAVSQVVYYNTSLFEEHKQEIPKTYAEFLAVCEAFKAAGVTPIANGVKDGWDVLECVFLGMLPNYVTGPEGRKPYETGEKHMNDEVFVKALEDFKALAPYLPEGFEATGYGDANALFGTGQAAMLLDGSWSCGSIKEQYGLETYSAFAFPAPEGNTAGLCFHPDMAITGNPKTAHPEEVKAFLAWLASPEGAQTASSYLPEGFFPMINAPIKLESEIANQILGLNEGKVTDARFIWPKFMTAYSALQDNLISVWTGKVTPQEAADAFAKAQEEVLTAK